MKHLIDRYKVLFVAMISLVVVCGCAKTETDTPAQPEDRLYFNATLDERGDEQSAMRGYSSDIDFATRGFTVAGYRTNGAFSTSNPNSLPFPNVFDYLDPGTAQPVIKVAIDATETNDNRKYWTALPRLPLSNVYNISYFAWSSSLDNTITATTSTATDKGAPWIEATVGAADTAQPDIVGALSMNHSNEYTVSAIDFDFKHLLSKMSFLVKTSNGMTANITNVTCEYGASAVYSQARFTFDGTADVGSWGDYKTYLTAGAVTATNWNTINGTTTTSALLGSMTLIPQNLTDNALSLNITYTTVQGGVTSEPVTRNVPLKAIDLKPGKNYLYTLNLNANEITFKVKVEGWIEMLGTDKGLPLVPGDMDPDVLLLLEGTDPPYTTADGSKYWLDRSGWNRHCLIVDKTQYNGTNAFDITYNPQKRGYEFNRADFYSGNLYNHIRIPNLGTVNGNVSCEVVCSKLPATNWIIPLPLAISQGERAYGEYPYKGRTLLLSIDESDKNNWDYATGALNGESTASSYFERLSLTTPTGYDWDRLSFYGYSRANGGQKFSVIDNTNSSSQTASNNTTGYPLTHGMIGAAFKGIINYVKISKKTVSFDDMMTDYGDAAKKYYIKTASGAYAPPLSGLLACWDARTGLVQGASDGNGAYWMDQSGNGYFLRADVPQGTNPKASITYNSSRKAIVFSGPSYYSSPRRGVALINPISMGKTKVLTFELVYQGNGADLSYSLQFRNKKGGLDAVNCRAFTGDGFETSHYVGGGAAANRIAYLYKQRTQSIAIARQHVVTTIDYEKREITMYVNGVKQTFDGTTGNSNEMPAPQNAEMELGYTILGNQKNLEQAFGGDVHAFRIYNRALTLTEIQANYNKDRAAFGF